MNIQTGHWVGKQSGLGAGSDSFYEYLLKSYILFGEKEDLEMFIDAYQNIQNHLRRGYVTSYEFHFSKHIYILVRYDGLYNVWSPSRKFLFSSSKKKTLFLWYSLWKESYGLYGTVGAKKLSWLPSNSVNPRLREGCGNVKAMY